MRRAGWLLVLSAGITARGLAQSEKVGVAMAINASAEPNGARKPIIYLRNLLGDSRWTQALDNSLPIVINYHLETWRSRDGWIDELISEVEWQTVVAKEPLEDEYTVTLVVGTRAQRPNRFAVRDSADHYLQRPQRVDVFPTRSGRFYYTLSVRITALSDADVAQLERFLAGDAEPDVTDQGTLFGRGIRRILLRIAGLPSEVLQAKTEEFEVRGDGTRP
jgi:hypothetical protein